MRTPRRAGWVVAVLCAATVALALGATTLSERLRPPHAPPGDLFAPVRVTRIDVHQRLAPDTADVALQVADVEGLDAIVNLSGGADGDGLEAQLAGARPGRIVVFMQLDPEGCCDDVWVAREAARLRRGKALGARGLAVGPEVARDEPGSGRTPAAGGAGMEPLRVDSARLQPIWDACAALELPVSIGRLDAAGRAAQRPQRADGAGAASPSQVLDAIARVTERNARVPFLLGALGDDDADAPGTLARLVARLPNLWIDLAGRIPALGRDPEASRALLIVHADRVLFGSGAGYVSDGTDRGIVVGAGPPILLDRLLGGRERRLFFESAYRFLETRDRFVPGLEGAPPIVGVGLPRRVLEQIYHRNAERLLGLAAQEARR